MSKNRNRAKTKNVHNNKEYCLLIMSEKYPPYWDDGVIWYPKHRKGHKNPNKTIMSYEVRRYKTWKYNRKTKWK